MQNAFSIDPKTIEGFYSEEWDTKEAAAIISQVTDLLSVQWPEIKKIVEDNDGKISLALKVDIDHSPNNNRIVQVGISFSKKFKDSCEVQTVTNPDQSEFPI